MKRVTVIATQQEGTGYWEVRIRGRVRGSYQIAAGFSSELARAVAIARHDFRGYRRMCSGCPFCKSTPGRR